jgi:hypothetical protein
MRPASFPNAGKIVWHSRPRLWPAIPQFNLGAPGQNRTGDLRIRFRCSIVVLGYTTFPLSYGRKLVPEAPSSGSRPKVVV